MLVKIGIPVCSILGFLLWGCLLLVLVVLWAFAGFLLFRSRKAGDEASQIWSQLVSAIFVVVLAVGEGIRRTKLVVRMLKDSGLEASNIRQRANATGRQGASINRKIDDFVMSVAPKKVGGPGGAELQA